MKSIGFFRAMMFGLSANFYCIALVRSSDDIWLPALASGLLVGALNWDHP